MEDNKFYHYIQYNVKSITNNDALKIYLQECNTDELLNLLNNIEYLKQDHKIINVAYIPTRYDCRIIATLDNEKEYNIKLPPRVIFHDKVE